MKLLILFLSIWLQWLTAIVMAAPILQSELSLSGSELDYFGSSVSISENYALVGESGKGHSTGHAFFYKREKTSWKQTAKIAPSSQVLHKISQFGSSVSLSDDFAIIGAPYSIQQGYGRVGAAYIFKRQSDTWIQELEIINTDRALDNYFGSSVSISGDYIAIGAYNSGDGSKGAVYIYRHDVNGWIEDAKIITTSEDIRFGWKVHLSDNFLIVGAYSHGSSTQGCAYIYKKEGENWNLQAQLKPDNTNTDSRFGTAVSISNGYAIVGAEQDNNGTNPNKKKSGAAYIYQLGTLGWEFKAKLTASDSSRGDHFGNAVSITERYAIVGAEWQNVKTGAAYLFYHQEEDWIETAKIIADKQEKQDLFANDLSIAGSTLIVGAHGKSKGNGILGTTYIYEIENVNLTFESDNQLSNGEIDSEPDYNLYDNLIPPVEGLSTETVLNIDINTDILSTDTTDDTSSEYSDLTQSEADLDGDGLSDSDEINIYGTNPSLSDTDGDNLTDFDEVFVHRSDPLFYDSDADGLSDYDEVIIHQSDVYMVDTDGDNLSDYQEVNSSLTDPVLYDTDKDGLSDSEEFEILLTNPLLADTDGDGLNDKEELYVQTTDPFVADSDNDQISDGNEVNYFQTDPLTSSSETYSPSVGNSYTPGESVNGILAYEDQWPFKGDYDFNDAVLSYNVVEKKYDGLVRQIIFKIHPLAMGATFQNAFNFLLNTPISNIASSYIKSRGETKILNPIADGNQTLFEVIKDIKTAIPPPKGYKMSNTISKSPKVTGTLYTVTINLKSGIDPAILGAPPYNSFISRVNNDGEIVEVHLPGKRPSKKMTSWRLGMYDDSSDPDSKRYYQTADNLPWAILIPEKWHHMKERVDISNGYPDILNWATSKGKKHKGWYKSKRHGKFVFEKVVDIDKKNKNK